MFLIFFVHSKFRDWTDDLLVINPFRSPSSISSIKLDNEHTMYFNWLMPSRISTWTISDTDVCEEHDPSSTKENRSFLSSSKLTNSVSSWTVLQCNSATCGKFTCSPTEQLFPPAFLTLQPAHLQKCNSPCSASCRFHGTYLCSKQM